VSPQIYFNNNICDIFTAENSLKNSIVNTNQKNKEFEKESKGFGSFLIRIQLKENASDGSATIKNEESNCSNRSFVDSAQLNEPVLYQMRGARVQQKGQLRYD
jgi:hypothetical protein